MLVITRKPGEAVCIDTGDRTTTVKVLWVGEGRVKLGIASPSEIRVDRDEVRARMIEEELGGES